ncbi:MAG: glycosyltransferase [Candidatus Njordarchaeia archaeon]
MNVSIGICAYNEEKNIGRLLRSLLKQKTRLVNIKEIIVVSSGSTDKTNEIVKEISKIDERVKLIVQEKRLGKASAVNEFLRVAEGEILVLESADTVPLKNTIERLCMPFLNHHVGMTCSRPMPVNPKDSFIGFLGHLVWTLHHLISLESPKGGELIAFRRLIRAIPTDICTDEAWIQAEVLRKGYTVVYVPQAICLNRAPETLIDFLRQRRRIYAGHLDLRRRKGYSPPTMSILRIIKHFGVIQKILSGFGLKLILYIPLAVFLESVARFLGWFDYNIRKENYKIWTLATTTKEVRL